MPEIEALHFVENTRNPFTFFLEGWFLFTFTEEVRNKICIQINEDANLEDNGLQNWRCTLNHSVRDLPTLPFPDGSEPLPLFLETI